MVDLALLQSVSYIAGALGVCVAAAYYILNMKETAKNRRLAFTSNILGNLGSKEASRDWYELMSMEWTDFDDFTKKYDSRVNPENFILRNHMWGWFDSIGWHLRMGVVDWETVRKSGRSIHTAWRKFKPIVEEYRRREFGSESYVDWEYLADRMDVYMSVEDKKRRQFMTDDAFKHVESRAV